MRHEHHDAALGDVFADQLGETGDAANIQRREGLVENPKRNAAREPEPRERHAAALPLRELAGRRLHKVREADGIERVERFGLLEACDASVDEHVLNDGKIVLHAVAVPDVAKLSPVVLRSLQNRRAAPEDLALDRAHEPCHEAKQRRLPGAVRARNPNKRTRLHGKREPLKERSFAALAGERAHF